MEPKQFWTVTDASTENTNSRSYRYDTEKLAIAEATRRIGRGVKGVYILKAVKLVLPKPVPVEVVEVVTSELEP